MVGASNKASSLPQSRCSLYGIRPNPNGVQWAAVFAKICSYFRIHAAKLVSVPNQKLYRNVTSLLVFALFALCLSALPQCSRSHVPSQHSPSHATPSSNSEPLYRQRRQIREGVLEFDRRWGTDSKCREKHQRAQCVQPINPLKSMAQPGRPPALGPPSVTEPHLPPAILAHETRPAHYVLI